MRLNTSPLQELDLSFYGIDNKVYIKRDDLIHHIISGNKWRKLKYNLLHFKTLNKKGIISMGGAYSTHILALSYLCREYSIPCRLMVRGEKTHPLNDILSKCISYNASIHYLTRDHYKDNSWIRNFMIKNHNDYFFIPEGGANYYGIYGCQKITDEIKIPFDYIFCEVGTGTTFSGIVSSLNKGQKCFGTVVLKGAENININISNFFNIQMKKKLNKQFILSHDYHFGGYAKNNVKLIEFMKEFYQVTGIKTDPIYSGKLFYSLIDQLRTKSMFKNKTIIALHSGGISGIKGFEKRYGIKIFN
ncbi:MAG: pyridoxal-phosphate dependent enzyme [Crocinitomicaceae bacterium TMED135]|nr:MAG: pyridoxal-phosphate dependent enzyme [Crocinitomicaceae bacterium TMED135]